MTKGLESPLFKKHIAAPWREMGQYMFLEIPFQLSKLSTHNPMSNSSKKHANPFPSPLPNLDQLCDSNLVVVKETCFMGMVESSSQGRSSVSQACEAPQRETRLLAVTCVHVSEFTLNTPLLPFPICK